MSWDVAQRCLTDICESHKTGDSLRYTGKVRAKDVDWEGDVSVNMYAWMNELISTFKNLPAKGIAILINVKTCDHLSNQWQDAFLITNAVMHRETEMLFWYQ